MKIKFLAVLLMITAIFQSVNARAVVADNELVLQLPPPPPPPRRPPPPPRIHIKSPFGHHRHHRRAHRRLHIHLPPPPPRPPRP